MRRADLRVLRAKQESHLVVSQRLRRISLAFEDAGESRLGLCIIGRDVEDLAVTLSGALEVAFQLQRGGEIVFRLAAGILQADRLAVLSNSPVEIVLPLEQRAQLGVKLSV